MRLVLLMQSLELGIDLGNLSAFGQIGCPWSVSSLVQRLDRSGPVPVHQGFHLPFGVLRVRI